MHTVTSADLASLRHWFTPERPGPVLFPHLERSGLGRCRVDREHDPRVVLAELQGNYALRGDPAHLPEGFAEITGFVEAPEVWLPTLQRIDPATAAWKRVIAVLPDEVPPLPAVAGVRRLATADVDALAALDPGIAWIDETWGGPAGLAAAGVAHGAFDGDRLVSVAAAFYVGTRYEDIGVVTDPGHRRRGLSAACAAAVVADIRARGHRPTWTTSPDNTGSLAVATRLGFVPERSDVLYAVGVPIPTE